MGGSGWRAGTWYLPDGTTTEDIEEYVSVWEAFAEPFIQLTGMRLSYYGYSTARFVVEDGSVVVDIQVEVLRRINKGLEYMNEEYLTDMEKMRLGLLK